MVKEKNLDKQIHKNAIVSILTSADNMFATCGEKAIEDILLYLNAAFSIAMQEDLDEIDDVFIFMDKLNELLDDCNSEYRFVKSSIKFRFRLAKIVNGLD